MSESRNRQWLLDQHLEELRRRHKENQEWWRALDNKAQANITGCGILLAATFVVFGKVLDCTSLPHSILLTITLWALLASITSSIVALLIRHTKTPPEIASVSKTLAHILKALNAAPADEHEQLIERFVLDQFEPLEVAIQDDTRAAKRKALRILVSQAMLIGATLLIGILSSITVLSPPCVSPKQPCPCPEQERVLNSASNGSNATCSCNCNDGREGPVGKQGDPGRPGRQGPPGSSAPAVTQIICQPVSSVPPQ